MVKPLSFKGDKKPHKKRKREPKDTEEEGDSAKQLVAVDAIPQTDEDWVSADQVTDISGPVLLVLSTSPVSCIAVDSFGKVFTSPIENMVEDEPGSAEPHDVRQVWIGQRIVGMENSFTFKGHHGKYLGCDQHGVLSAEREAVSPEETFKCTLASPNRPSIFDIQTGRATYLTVDTSPQHPAQPPQLRGDADAPGDATAVRIRMQARFKPQLKVDKAEKVRAKISRQELEAAAGRRLDEAEVKVLKRARREGNYHEAMLDVKVKGKHDKYA